MKHEVVMDELRTLVKERDWAQFHSPENLAKSITIESSELLELFQWGAPSDLDAVKMELADVLTYAFLLADELGVQPHELIHEKLAITREKYPVDESFGRSDKYDQL